MQNIESIEMQKENKNTEMLKINWKITKRLTINAEIIRLVQTFKTQPSALYKSFK